MAQIMPPTLACQPSPPHGKRVLLITHHQRSVSSRHDADSWYQASPKGLPPRELPGRLRSLGSFSWVSTLPCASELSVSLCLRGLTCADVLPRARAEVSPATLHSCFEEPGGRANGTESVCAFRFLVDNYDTPGWDGVYFAHDDIAVNQAHRWPRAALKNFLAANAWPPWPAEGATEASCGCGLVGHEVLRPGYYWYASLRWCLHEWLGHEAGSAPLSGSGFKWPSAFMFHVDAETVRRRSRRFYRYMHHVARSGVTMRPLGAWGGGGGVGSSRVSRRLDPDQLGHVIERLPFLLLGRAFNESAATGGPLPPPAAAAAAAASRRPGARLIVGSPRTATMVRRAAAIHAHAAARASERRGGARPQRP